MHRLALCIVVKAAAVNLVSPVGAIDNEVFMLRGFDPFAIKAADVPEKVRGMIFTLIRRCEFRLVDLASHLDKPVQFGLHRGGSGRICGKE